MRRKLSPWGWAAAGALSVVVALWAGTTVYTLLKQRSDERRVTRIERVVLGLGGAKKLDGPHRHRAAGDGQATPRPTGANPNPSKSVEGSGQGTEGTGNGAGKGGHGKGHSGGHSQGHNPGPTSPAPTSGANPTPAARDTGADIQAPSPGNSEGNGASGESKAGGVAEGADNAAEGIGASVGGVVKEAGETVNNPFGQAVEHVQGNACEVAGVGCSH